MGSSFPGRSRGDLPSLARREARRAPVAVLFEGERPDPAHPRECGLRDGEEHGHEEQHDDGEDHHPVGSAHGIAARAVAMSLALRRAYFDNLDRWVYENRRY